MDYIRKCRYQCMEDLPRLCGCRRLRQQKPIDEIHLGQRRESKNHPWFPRSLSAGTVFPGIWACLQRLRKKNTVYPDPEPELHYQCGTERLVLTYWVILHHISIQCKPEVEIGPEEGSRMLEVSALISFQRYWLSNIFIFPSAKETLLNLIFNLISTIFELHSVI